MNDPIQNIKQQKAFDGATVYLKMLEDAIKESETTTARLMATRSTIKREILGENLNGMSKVLSDAGPAIEPSNNAADDALMKQLEKDLAEEAKKTK